MISSHKKIDRRKFITKVGLSGIKMVYCTVPQCTSFAGKTMNVKFHSFPRDVIMADKWNLILKRGKPYTKNIKVCSLHFTQADYKITSYGHSNTLLSKDAVPSQNLPKLNPDGTVMVIKRRHTINYKESKKDDHSIGDKVEKKWSCVSQTTLSMTAELPQEQQDNNKSHNSYDKVDYQKSVLENGYPKIQDVYNGYLEKEYQNRPDFVYQSPYQDSVEILRNQQHNLQVLQEQHRINENQNFFNENHIKQEIDFGNDEDKFIYEQNKEQIESTSPTEEQYAQMSPPIPITSSLEHNDSSDNTHIVNEPTNMELYTNTHKDLTHTDTFKCEQYSKCFKDPDVHLLHKRSHTKSHTDNETGNTKEILKANPILANLLRSNAPQTSIRNETGGVFNVKNVNSIENQIMSALTANLENNLRNLSTIMTNGNTDDVENDVKNGTDTDSKRDLKSNCDKQNLYDSILIIDEDPYGLIHNELSEA